MGTNQLVQRTLLTFFHSFKIMSHESKTSVSFVQVISWGLIIAMAVVGFLWSKVIAIDSELDAQKDKEMEILLKVTKIEKDVELLLKLHQ